NCRAWLRVSASESLRFGSFQAARAAFGGEHSPPLGRPHRAARAETGTLRPPDGGFPCRSGLRARAVAAVARHVRCAWLNSFRGSGVSLLVFSYELSFCVNPTAT